MAAEEAAKDEHTKPPWVKMVKLALSLTSLRNMEVASG